MGRRDKRDTMFTFMIYSSQRRCCECCFCPSYFLQLRNKSGEFSATLLQHWLEREEGWSAGCLPVYLLTWKQGKIFIFDKSEVQTYFPPSFWQGRIIACVYIMPPTVCIVIHCAILFRMPGPSHGRGCRVIKTVATLSIHQLPPLPVPPNILQAAHAQDVLCFARKDGCFLTFHADVLEEKIETTLLF